MDPDSVKSPKLDEKARKILYELDVNARQSYAQIGKKVGLSKDMVNYRIKQMEDLGLIKNYYAVLDVSKLGYINFRVYLKYHNLNPVAEKEIIGYLKKHPNVGWIVSIWGHWDTNMLVWVESVYEFKTFWDTFFEKFQNYIDDKEISIVTNMLQYKKSFLLKGAQDNDEPDETGGHQQVSIDDKDWSILRCIASNARMPILDVAKQTGLSAKVVEYRIKNLVKKKIILRFKALLHLGMLGVRYFKVNFTLHNMTKQCEKELLAYMQYHPNIVITALTIGGADFEIEIYAKKTQEFRQIIKDIRTKFHNIIRHSQVMEYYREYKWAYLPQTKK